MVFIAFEGLDGSGKTTQVEVLSERLLGLGFSVYCVREPTGGEVGVLIREILSGGKQVSDIALSFLFLADRIDHLGELREKLSKFDIVISDRNFFSNIAYGALSLSMESLIYLEDLICLDRVTRPDLHIFLDLPLRECLERVSSSEIYESDFILGTVRDNYFKAFELCSSEVVEVIDGRGSIEVVGKRIFDFISSRRFYKVLSDRRGSGIYK